MCSPAACSLSRCPCRVPASFGARPLSFLLLRATTGPILDASRIAGIRLSATNPDRRIRDLGRTDSGIHERRSVNSERSIPFGRRCREHTRANRALEVAEAGTEAVGGQVESVCWFRSPGSYQPGFHAVATPRPNWRSDGTEWAATSLEGLDSAAQLRAHAGIKRRSGMRVPDHRFCSVDTLWYQLVDSVAIVTARSGRLYTARWVSILDNGHICSRSVAVWRRGARAAVVSCDGLLSLAWRAIGSVP